MKPVFGRFESETRLKFIKFALRVTLIDVSVSYRYKFLQENLLFKLENREDLNSAYPLALYCSWSVSADKPNCPLRKTIIVNKVSVQSSAASLRLLIKCVFIFNRNLCITSLCSELRKGRYLPFFHTSEMFYLIDCNGGQCKGFN